MCEIADSSADYPFNDIHAESGNYQPLPNLEGAIILLASNVVEQKTDMYPAKSSTVLQNSQADTAAKGSRRKKRERTLRIALYFTEVDVLENGICVKKSQCVMDGCRFIISGIDSRLRRFYIIVCPKHQLSRRQYYHAICNAKNKPPLLKNPPELMTYQEVIRYAKTLNDRALNYFCNDLINPVLWNGDTIFSAFRNAADLLNTTRRGEAVSDSEQEIFNLLLTRLIVSNSFPFSIVVRKKNEKISGLAQILKFLRPGIRCRALRSSGANSFPSITHWSKLE